MFTHPLFRFVAPCVARVARMAGIGVGEELQLSRIEGSLVSAEKNLGSMAAQQAVLYRDHINAFNTWVKRTKDLRQRVEAEQQKVADAKVKADRLDKLVAVLEETDEGKLRDEIRVLTRDVAKCVKMLQCSVCCASPAGGFFLEGVFICWRCGVWLVVVSTSCSLR